MKKHQIALVGLVATGTTTAAENVVQRFAESRITWTHIPGGAIMRQVAAEKYSEIEDPEARLKKLRQAIKVDPSLDRLIDGKTKLIGQTRECVVVEARLAAWLMPDAYSVYMYSEDRVRAERAAQRALREKLNFPKGSPCPVPSDKAILDAWNDMSIREQQDDDRYECFYGIQRLYRQVEFHDHIDTTHMSPTDVLDRIVKGFSQWIAKG